MQARHLAVSRRQILYGIGDVLAGVRAAPPAKIETPRPYFQQPGLVLSLDGLEPEPGNEMLFVVREANRDRATLRPRSRKLSQAPQDDPWLAVFVHYCEGLRDDLRAEGMSPFELAGQ